MPTILILFFCILAILCSTTNHDRMAEHLQANRTIHRRFCSLEEPTFPFEERKKQDTIVNLNGQYTEAQRRKMLGTFVTFLPRNRNTTFESHNRSQNLWNSRSNDRFFVTRIEANGVCLAEYLLDVEKSGQKFDGICV